MIIRKAVAADAEQACDVLRRSIIELCTADHCGDDARLGLWLANKTPGNLRVWIAAPDQVLVVAEEDGSLTGVGAASFDGEILLNYVDPEARFRGVSKAVLRYMEDIVRLNGVKVCNLVSTRTAYRFYQASGYVDAEEQGAHGNRSGHRMFKTL